MVRDVRDHGCGSRRDRSRVVAYLDEGDWNVAELPDRALDTVDTIAKELRRYPGENGALAMLSVAEDFVLFVRAQGSLVRVLLSDVTASTDWTLARSAINHIGVLRRRRGRPGPRR